jgi:hypothetical protein
MCFFQIIAEKLPFLKSLLHLPFLNHLFLVHHFAGLGRQLIGRHSVGINFFLLVHTPPFGSLLLPYLPFLQLFELSSCNTGGRPHHWGQPAECAGSHAETRPRSQGSENCWVWRKNGNRINSILVFYFLTFYNL